MATTDIPLSAKFIEARDIIGFSADYFLEAFKELPDEKLQHVIYALCSNLYRMESQLDKELLTDGIDLKNRNLESSAFVDDRNSSIKMSQVISEFLEERRGSGEQELLRKIL